MKKRFDLLRVAGAYFLCLFIPQAEAMLPPAHRPDLPGFDQRAPAAQKPERNVERERGQSHLHAQLPATSVDFDPLLDTPSFVRASRGFLTGHNGQGRAVSALSAQAFSANDPHRAVKAFLNEHSALFGHGHESLQSAKISRESVGSHNGLRTVVWQQELDEIPVFEATLIGNITRQGELVSLASRFLPDPARGADAGVKNRRSLQSRPPISAERAIVNAAQNLGGSVALRDVQPEAKSNAGGYLVFNIGAIPAYARLVWLPMNRELMRLAWEVMLSSQTSREQFQFLIDAQSGEAIVRRAMTRYISDATYNVYTSDSPSPFSPGNQTPSAFQPPLTNRVLVTTPALDVNASPNGWINDGDNVTTGNNADTFVDRNFDFQPDGPRPTGTPPRVFDFPLDLTQDPLTYSNASTVQMFYWLNWYHDRLYQLGFTESAGNYQTDNFGRGGLGNDNMIGFVQSGAGIGLRDNAFFIPSPDGFNGRIAMFQWSSPNPERDGDLDAEVIFHEATHGTSERLVGGGVLISALQTAGMGEGWSDFYSQSLLSEPADDPDAAYAEGGYVTYNWFGLLTANYYFGVRHFPYCTDMTKNPFTFKDIDPAQIDPHTGVPRSPIYGFFPPEADEVHHQGEVWCVTLWGARANLVRKYGYIGNETMLQLVTDGMKLGPANPNFLQARDAIILADQVDNGGANFLDLWRAFARRGMGVSATSPSSATTAGVREAFDLPGLDIGQIVILGGNGNGIIDFNECNDVLIYLVNHGTNSATGISGRLSSSTPGVVIAQPFSTYPDLPLGATNVNAVPFKMSTTPNFVCGTPVLLNFLLKTDQETVTNQLQLTSGTNSTVFRFDSAFPVAIPDNDPAGTNSLVVVSNITGAIGKVTVSLYLTHTFDADLTLELISPDGITNTLSANNGGAGNNYGIACNPDFRRTTFDDAALLPVTSGAPPFVGSFQPEDRLAIFVGKSGTNVNGTWKLHVFDSAAIDVGIIQCWSLNLLSATCPDGGGECPGSDLALGMTASPEPVITGNNLTYTISVTNNGPSSAKNVTVSHLLPGSVAFVSATSSQGNCSQSSGVVTCNLGTVLPGGRATITVIVVPTAAGTISSSATVTSDQADFDTSNNTATVISHVNPPTADLAVGILDAPDPVVVGGTLTYSVSVTNTGPGTATGVILTNLLPGSVVLLNASVSQGTLTTTSNSVICTFGTLTNGGRASATINVTPTAPGTIQMTANAVANQFDPTPANSTATATTTVGPAADLGVSLTDTPDPVVVRSNLTYVVTVTNRGPNAATSVALANTLDSRVNLVTTNTSQGTISVQGNTVTANLGTIASGASAIVTIVVAPTTNGTISMSAAVSLAETDPNLGDNMATATTLVANPFVSIIPAGATLTAESFSPADGAIEIGETVTVILRLRNAGNVRNTNLVATLLATNGVTPVGNNTQTYGVLAPSGFPVGRSFTFTAGGTNGGTISPTLRLQDGALNIGEVSFTFSLPTSFSFANTNAITIRDNTSGLPYPSVLNVSGITGLVGKVTATLSNISHTFPQDVDVLLVGPAGQKTILMSGAGAPPLANADVTFDDSASSAVPDGASTIYSGSYRPANYAGVNLPSPAPAGPYPAAMSVFNSANANGAWSLYVADHTAGDAGNIAGGWSLGLNLITPVNQIIDLAVSGIGSPNPILAGGNLTYTFTITNSGPSQASFVVFTNVLPASVSFVSASSSQGVAATNASGVFATLGPVNAGAVATVMVTVNPSAAAAGLLTNTASVSASETDLNLANNTAAVITTVNLPFANAGVILTGAPNPAVVGSNLTYTATVTNTGPGTALDVVLTDPLPPGTTFVSASSPCTNIGGTVTCALGPLAANSGATVTLTLTASNIGNLTNTVSVSTTSTDTNLANNSSSFVVAVSNRAPIIVAAGALLINEDYSPHNGAIDNGEPVTVALALRNIGSANTANLIATLLNSGGVSPLVNTQAAYGTLIAGGAAVTKNFSFTASGVNGGTIVASLQLQDGTTNLGTVAFTFILPTTRSFSNSAAIIIPDHGAASPYPSTISVSGQTGLVSKATVTLNGLSHSFPDDLDILLVNPTGKKVVLMSDAGGARSITNLTLTFGDAAGSVLPNSTQIVSGTYKPTDYDPGDSFPSPAPSGPQGTNLSSFNGTDPNGNWSLYVLDDSTGDAGVIAGGWSLTLTTVSTVNPVADLALGMSSAPAALYVGGTVTNTINITNLGPVSATGIIVTYTLASGVNLVSAIPSQGSLTGSSGGQVTCNLGSLSTGGNAKVTIIVAPSVGGPFLNSASVASSETDLNPANNVAQTTTTATTPAPARLVGALVNGQFQIIVTAEHGLKYTVQANTNLSTTNWVPLSTNTASFNGTFTFTDSNSPGLKARFYRVVRVLP